MSRLGVKRVLVPVLVVGALIVGGAPAYASTVRSAQSPKLSPLLLTIGQMPTGWILNNSSSGGGPGGTCPKPKGFKISEDAPETFVGPNAQVDEELTTYSVRAKLAFPKVVASIVACKRTKVASGDNKTVEASISQMSLPHFGNQSAAFEWRIAGSGKPVTIYELVIRSGNFVMAIDESSDGLPNVDQLESFTTSALAKLPATAVPPTISTATTVTTPPTTTTPTTAPNRSTAQSAPPGIAGPAPNVTGEELDQAEATLLAANLGYQTIGGGTFGVVIASDWTVCSQSPGAGTTASSVDLVVARSCT